jgi:hypothetical protein
MRCRKSWASRLFLLSLCAVPTSHAMDFTASACASQFHELQAYQGSFEGRPALQRLHQYLQDPAYPKTSTAHSLAVSARHAKLSIGTLRREEKKLNLLILKAIREGSLTEIDSGVVMGPKAVILLNRFKRESLHANVDLTVTGRWQANFLLRRFETERHLPGPKGSDPYLWTKNEAEEFESAAKELRLKDCNALAGIPASAFCEFRLSIRDGRSKLEYR